MKKIEISEYDAFTILQMIEILSDLKIRLTQEFGEDVLELNEKLEKETRNDK